MKVLIYVVFGFFFTFAPAQVQPPSAGEPEIVGESVISTPHDEFGGAWDVENRTIYFNMSIPRGYLYVICSSTLDTHGKWSKPVVMPFSGQYRDSDPVLSPDRKRLYFVSDRPVDGKRNKDFDIYVAERQGAGWGAPHRLSEIVNSSETEYFASEANSGNIYFSSARKGSVGEIDVYRGIKENGEIRRVESLGPSINAPGVANIEAFIAPDESYLLLGSFNRKDTLGSADLYISFNNNGTFSKPIPLPAGINTPARDYSPRISSDGKWFIFASERSPAMKPGVSPRTTEEIERLRTSVLNGLGNIYRLPLSSLRIREMRSQVNP